MRLLLPFSLTLLAFICPAICWPAQEEYQYPFDVPEADDEEGQIEQEEDADYSQGQHSLSLTICLAKT